MESSEVVAPAHKKGKKQLKKNKRPVSLTVVPCKIMERIIVENIMLNAEKQDLISRAQFGYRKEVNCSTTSRNL